MKPPSTKYNTVEYPRVYDMHFERRTNIRRLPSYQSVSIVWQGRFILKCHFPEVEDIVGGNDVPAPPQWRCSHVRTSSLGSADPALLLAGRLDMANVDLVEEMSKLHRQCSPSSPYLAAGRGMLLF